MPFDTKTYLIQVGLSSLGYNFGPNAQYGPLDGSMGPKTQAAIAAFEARQNPPSAGRSICQNGIDLVKAFEGCPLVAYQDEVGVWTIGYGHTGLKHNDGTVYAGRQITQQEAEDLLKYDMGVFGHRIETLVNVPLNDNEFAALVSFDFNTGGFEDSTMRKLINSNDFLAAADEFPKWNHAGGKVLAGLTRRRLSERNLFLGIEPFIIT